MKVQTGNIQILGHGSGSGLPLSNLKTRQPNEVARTTDTTNASTQFDVDLGATQGRADTVLGLAIGSSVQIVGP